MGIAPISLAIAATALLDAIFAWEGIQILRTPVQALWANVVAERWVGTVRRQLLDCMLELALVT